nr:Gal-binding and CUB domains containing receptor 5 [Arenicola marina]
MAPSLSSDVSEYCEWESFNATCSTDEIILIRSARYGRMSLGRCVTKNYGHIGCGTDVTSDFDSQCSGTNQCLVSVISLHGKRSCPKDFKSYLEAGYQCISVFHPQNTTCPPSGHIELTSPTGHVASTVTQETRLGTAACPWVIKVLPHQRINLTMLDFSLPPGSDPWFYQEANPTCQEYAAIREWKDTFNKTLCGGRRRESLVYQSQGNYLEISVVHPEALNGRFLLQYEAFGCPPLEVPDRAWMKTNGEHAMVQCNETNEAWYLTCKGRDWVGRVGNCSDPLLTGEDWKGVLSSVTDFPFGILIVVALGVAIGVAVGVMMLVAVLAYMKRRRRRKVRSRSNYILKQVADGVVGDPKPCMDYHSDRTPMLLKREGVECSTMPRQHLGTWQRSRPLPLPRPTSDSGIDQDGMTLTPDTPSSVFMTFRPDFDPRASLQLPPGAYGSYITDCNPCTPHRGEGPYYFKLDPTGAPVTSRLHSPHSPHGPCKPDIVSTCSICRGGNGPPVT